MRSTINSHKIKIVHVMADGAVRDSVEGLEPPQETGCYEILKRMIEKAEKEETA